MSGNRIEGMDEEQKKITGQKIMDTIMAQANELYDLIPTGMTVELNLPPTQPEVIVPNQPKQRRIILITRPRAVMILDHK